MAFFSKDKLFADKKELCHILFTTYYKDVYKVTYCILKNQYDTEEVVQDAFITAFEKINTLKDKEKFKPWICTISCNLAKKRLYRNKKQVLYDEIDKVIPFGMDQSPHMTVDEELQKKELKKYIREQIHSLPPQYSETLILYYFEQLSYQEIAELLDIKIGTVKSRLARAKERLLSNFTETMDEEGVYNGKRSIR